MELRQLRYFLAVVDAGSITCAARKLHVVQSALSHQVANLEAEFNTELLLRSNKGVQPTAAGLAMYRHAQAVIKNVDAIGQSLHALGNEVRTGSHCPTASGGKMTPSIFVGSPDQGQIT